MTISNLERAYDDMSYATKEFADMPSRFYQLDESVVNFLENLVDMLDKSDKSDNIEDVKAAKDLLSEIAVSLDDVLLRLGEDSVKS